MKSKFVYNDRTISNKQVHTSASATASGFIHRLQKLPSSSVLPKFATWTLHKQKRKKVSLDTWFDMPVQLRKQQQLYKGTRLPSLTKSYEEKKIMGRIE